MRPAPRRAFSLLELVIVIVMIGVIAAIAIPRMGSAADNSIKAALSADLAHVQHAVELYSAEHADRGPATELDGSTNTDGTVFVQRLLRPTEESGAIGGGSAIFGPYLRSWPRNPINSKASVRIGGAAAGANTHGWRFDPATRAFEADDKTIVGVQVGGGAVGVGVEADSGPGG